MESGHRLSWKVLENAYKKVLESHRKPLSVFCMQPEYKRSAILSPQLGGHTHSATDADRHNTFSARFAASLSKQRHQQLKCRSDELIDAEEALINFRHER